MVSENKDTSRFNPSGMAIFYYLLTMAGVLGTTWFMVGRGEYAHSLRGALACVVLLVVGFAGAAYERFAQLERRVDELRRSSNAQGDRAQRSAEPSAPADGGRDAGV
jgi:hypothetical protein